MNVGVVLPGVVHEGEVVVTKRRLMLILNSGGDLVVIHGGRV